MLGDEALGSSACASGERTRAHPQESVQVQFADLGAYVGSEVDAAHDSALAKIVRAARSRWSACEGAARLWSIDDFFDRMLGCAV